MYSQIKITAVKLVPRWHLTSVSSSKARLGFNDLHLKCVDLQPYEWGERYEGGLHDTLYNIYIIKSQL